MSRLSPQPDFRMAPYASTPQSQSVYGAGTAYSLTQTPALVNLGTTPISLTLNSPGTYLLLARTSIKYNAATFAAVRTVSLKLRRTNNTAADLTSAALSFLTQIITILTFTAGSLSIPPVIYSTVNNNDIIQLFGSIDTLPGAGSIDCTDGEIIAIKISN